MTYTATPPTTVTLDQPLRGASIGDAFLRFWKKYATFSGRASRSEFWWWFLISFLISGVLQGIGFSTADMRDPRSIQLGLGHLPYALWSLATIIPNLALSWRRLHDTNHSGLWNLISLVPLVGAIVLIVFWASGPDPAGRRFDR